MLLIELVNPDPGEKNATQCFPRKVLEFWCYCIPPSCSYLQCSRVEDLCSAAGSVSWGQEDVIN